MVSDRQRESRDPCRAALALSGRSPVLASGWRCRIRCPPVGELPV